MSLFPKGSPVCPSAHSSVRSCLVEPTCAHARWAFMHHFLSVCPSVCLSQDEKSDWTIIHISWTIWPMTKQLTCYLLCSGWPTYDNSQRKSRWAHVNVKLHFLDCIAWWFVLFLVVQSVNSQRGLILWEKRNPSVIWILNAQSTCKCSIEGF